MAFQKGHKFSGSRKGKPNRNPNRITTSFGVYLIEDLIGTFKSGKYYVYKHILHGEVIYIGKGSGDRAWNTSGRKSNHANIMMNEDIETRIISSDLSEIEALAIEVSLIKINNPKFNIRSTLE